MFYKHLARGRRFIIVFVLLIITSELTANGNVEALPLERDAEYIDYSYKFDRLDSNEELAYSYKNKKLTIYAKSDDINKRVIGIWENVYWGGIEFSSNRRKMVFGYYKKDFYYPLFLLDGDCGYVKYLFNTPNTSITNNDLSYLLCVDYNYNKKAQNEKTDGTFRFMLININDLELSNYVYWDLHERLGGSLRTFRSSDPLFNFRFVYSVESTLWADAYYNIETDELKTIVDDTLIQEWRSFKYKPTYEELGYIEPEE